MQYEKENNRNNKYLGVQILTFDLHFSKYIRVLILIILHKASHVTLTNINLHAFLC